MFYLILWATLWGFVTGVGVSLRTNPDWSRVL
jgi:hypothetical protein